MECDFENIDSTNNIITRYSKIDHGLFITGAEGVGLSYRGSFEDIIDLYRDNNCHQTIDQLCQPWIQLQYDMDQNAAGSANDRCKCLRYSQPIIFQGKASERYTYFGCFLLGYFYKRVVISLCLLVFFQIVKDIRSVYGKLYFYQFRYCHHL